MPTSTRLCFPKSWRGPVGHVQYTRVTPQSIVDRALTVFVLVSFTVGPKAWSDAMLRDITNCCLALVAATYWVLGILPLYGTSTCILAGSQFSQ